MEKKFPWQMWVVVLFATFEVAQRLWKLSLDLNLAIDANIFGPWVAPLFISTIIVATVIPALIIYGILKRKHWGKTLALSWFGFEVLLSIFFFIAAFFLKNLIAIDTEVIIEFCFYVFIVVYLFREKHFFNARA